MAPAKQSAGAAELIETFRQPEFNVAAFVRDATSRGTDSAARLTQCLEDCASDVDEELRRKIAACHEELLQNAGKVNDLDGDLGSVREVVESLKNSVARVRGDVLTPFNSVKQNVQLLSRVQAVNVLIRKLARFLFDARKLRTQMEVPTKDYSKAAHTLNELESVLQESSLERVDILRAEVTYIHETGSKVRKQAEEDLRNGVRQGNQINLSISLQVFFNLQCLWPQLQRVLAELLDEFDKAALIAGANFQQSLEMNLQVLIAHVQRIHLLDEIIRSKTDALTHRTFSAALEQEGVSSLTSHFWIEATKRFASKFSRVSQDRAARRMLVEGFPKTLNALTEAMDKVSLSSRGRGQILRVAEREAMYATVADIRNEFLGESIKRVTEPVEMMLPDKLLASLAATGESHTDRQLAGGADAGGLTDELPTSHDLRRYVQLLVAELERNECCPDMLLKEAIRSVRSSVLLFATRLEQIIDAGCVELRIFQDEVAPRLSTPLQMPAAGHARNARLFGIAHHTLLVLKETIPTRFQAAIMAQQVQNTLQQTQSAIISPMMDSLQRVARAGTTQLGPAAAEQRTADGSPALLVLSQASAHVSRHYFSLFGAGQLLPYLKDLCAFIIRSFLVAAVLKKPLDEAAKGAILQDMQSVEMALSSLDNEFQAHVRHETGIFNEFRRMLFMPETGASELEDLSNTIPLPLLLVYLVHQLPAQVPSLYEFCGESAAAFAEGTLLPLWQEEPGALEALKAKVKQLNAKFGIDRCIDPVASFLKAQVK